MDNRFRHRMRGGFILLLFAVLLFSGLAVVPETALADQTTIQPSTKDAYTILDSPDNNYGTLTILSVGNYPGTTSDVYVVWSVASIPTGSTIINASMELYLYDRYPDSTEIEAIARRVTGSWTETGITWNNAPSTTAAGSSLATIPIDDTGLWIYWNIAEIVDAWVNGGSANQGVSIKPAGPFGFVLFYSKEFATASLRPRLVIEYTPPSPPGPGFVVQISGGQTAVPAQVNTNITIPIDLYNTGDITLNVVWIQIINHTNAAVSNRNETSLLITEDATNPRRLSIVVPSSANTATGSFAWYLNGTYEASDPDTVYSWPFTLNGQTDPVAAFFAVEASLDSTLLPIDTTTRLEVRITSSPDTTAIQYFSIVITSTSLIASPDSIRVTVAPSSVRPRRCDNRGR